MSSKIRGWRLPMVAGLMMAVGGGWLLTVLEVIPGVNWAWTLGLAATGLLIPLLTGIDKFSAVAGPFLIATAACSLLRQNGAIDVATEAPLLVMTAGALLLVPYFLNLPRPAWLLDELSMTE